MVSEEYYYNLTIGRDSILGKNRQHVKSAHLYCEIQGGSFGSYYPLSAGAGMGAAIFTGDNDYKIHPKFSLFGGAGIFITLDYIYGKNLTALGLQSVLPVAFKKSYRNLRQ